MGRSGRGTLQSVLNPNSPDFLRCLIETRCPNTTGVFIYISVLFQILSALQRSEPAGRHAAGSHCSLLSLIKTLKKKKSYFKKRGREKKRTLPFLNGQWQIIMQRSVQSQNKWRHLLISCGWMDDSLYCCVAYNRAYNVTLSFSSLARQAGTFSRDFLLYYNYFF